MRRGSSPIQCMSEEGKSPVCVFVFADGLEKGRRLGCPLGVQVLAPFPVPAQRSLKFREEFQVQPGKSADEKDCVEEHAGRTSVLSRAISRPIDVRLAIKWRRKELLAGASPARTQSSRKKGERSTESGES